ncbi:hypothetical protein TWF718_010614 [Orbilia javanica]|uniref:Uncharacterized protein n=1 Tax=Orbilia javanica TaxID=47235 RepID=A0AAN8MIE0_9PEZI
MSFAPAQYYIYGSGPFANRTVSRSTIEDRSLFPKQIWLLSPGTQISFPWTVIKSDTGYVFQSRGASIGEDEEAVVAIINERWNTYIDWTVEPVQNDEDIYRIRTQDGKYWTIEEERGRAGNRIVLRNSGEGVQDFRIVRINTDLTEEEYEYAYHRTNHREHRGSGKGLDADPQSRFGYGKRQKTFCS